MTQSPQLQIHRGEVWTINFDPQVGKEITKIRPAVVMNIPTAGLLPLHIVVPITTGNPRFSQYFWMLPIIATTSNGLQHDSFADCFQVKSLAEQRFVRKLGILTQAETTELADIIAMIVGYSPKK